MEKGFIAYSYVEFFDLCGFLVLKWRPLIGKHCYGVLVPGILGTHQFTELTLNVIQ